MPRVFIPAALRPLANGQQVVEAPGSTVAEVVDQLDARFPNLKSRLVDNGRLRTGLMVVVGSSASSLGLLQKVAPDDEIHFLPVTGGG